MGQRHLEVNEPLARDTVVAPSPEGERLLAMNFGRDKAFGGGVMIKIYQDFRVARLDEYQFRLRRRGNVWAYGFVALAVALPLCAPVIILIA